MAYSTANPPNLLAQVMARGVNNEGRLWVYTHIDAPALVRVSGYFTNGFDIGLRVNDTVIVTDSDATPVTTSLMIVTSDTNGVIDLSDGTPITATDTD
tara:strand:- start:10266 stop:10559 length:294 start_codon:yes stop_codon:yes gene_type:complete